MNSILCTGMYIAMHAVMYGTVSAAAVGAKVI